MRDSVVDDSKTDPTSVLLEQRLVAQALAEMGFWLSVSGGGRFRENGQE